MWVCERGLEGVVAKRLRDPYRRAPLIVVETREVPLPPTHSSGWENPWGDRHGKPISVQTLSRFLKPFHIKTMPVWVDAALGTLRLTELAAMCERGEL
jgi:hypothetical protein